MFWASIRPRYGAGEKHTEYRLDFPSLAPCKVQGSKPSFLSDFNATPLNKPLNPLIIKVFCSGMLVALYALLYLKG